MTERKGFRLFKTTYKDKQGRRRQAAKSYVEFNDHLECTRRLPAFLSKAASEEMGRSVVKLVAYFKGSGGQIDPALTRWLTGLPQRTLDKLVAIGLLATDRVATAKSLADHLGDFAKVLTAKGNSPFHVETVTGRARRIIDGCGFRFYGDIKASKVMECLDELRTDKNKKRGIGAQTFNFYLSAIKQFCRWMMKDRRATESPVAHLDGLNVKTDRRRDRRPFTVEELRRLLDSTRSGPDRDDMTGEERWMLYWLAVETGLRAGELRSLTRASFDLDTDGPTVTVAAAYSKHRREDTLPLRQQLCKALAVFLATKMPGAPVFRMPARKRMAEVFQEDLAAARSAWVEEAVTPEDRAKREGSSVLRYRDDSGRFADFHALRHTFITNLATGGVHRRRRRPWPGIAQSR